MALAKGVAASILPVAPASAPAKGVAASILPVAPASAPAKGVAASIIFQQGDNDYGIAYAAASAVHHAGDPAAARAIASLAAESIKHSLGVKRVKWMTRETLDRVQPSWQVLSKALKGVHTLTKEVLMDVLLAIPKGVVTILQIKDSEGNDHHYVAVHDGWLFDPIKPRAVPLNIAGLDACCLGSASFVKAYAGFQLVRQGESAQAATKRLASENDAPNATASPKSRKRKVPIMHTCFMCKESQPVGEFSKNQLNESKGKCNLCIKSS